MATHGVFLLSLIPDKTRSQKCIHSAVSVQKSEDSNSDLQSFIFMYFINLARGVIKAYFKIIPTIKVSKFSFEKPYAEQQARINCY